MRLWNKLALAPFPLPFRPFAFAAGRWPGLLLGLALGLAAQGARAGDAEPAEGEPSWIPSLSVDFETFQYSTTSTVTNLVNPPAQEGNVSHGSAQLVARIGAELMGPRLEVLPGRPRLFASGGVGINTFSESKIADIGVLQGDPYRAIQQFRAVRRQDFLFGCTTKVPQTCITADAADFEGQGSQVTGQPRTPEWNAALGVAFEFPLRRSLLLQVKPSVTYNYEKVRLGGRIRTVVEEPAGPTYNEQEVFTIYQGTGSSSSIDHSLGLGLALDLAPFRSTRPIRASLFLDTRFLWLLSDRTTSFSDSSAEQVSFPTPVTPVTTPWDPIGAYRVKRDAFEIRGGAGVRLTWVGLGPR